MVRRGIPRIMFLCKFNVKNYSLTTLEGYFVHFVFIIVFCTMTQVPYILVSGDPLVQSNKAIDECGKLHTIEIVK